MSLEDDLVSTNNLSLENPDFPPFDEFELLPIDEYTFWDLTDLPPSPALNTFNMNQIRDPAKFLTSPYTTSWTPERIFDPGDELWWMARDT